MLIALVVALILMAVVMTTAWAVSLKTDNTGWIDVFWTFGTGLTGVVVALAPWAGTPSAREILVAVLVAVWSVRLGAYIAVRVARGAEDARYLMLKDEWGAAFKGRLFGLAIVQAPATTLLCASIAAAALRPGAGLTPEDVIGAVILLIAIVGEGRADGQMKRFKADSSNHGKIMDQGLWGLSRHPNYVFEWFGWLAWPVIAIDLSGAWPQGWASLIAPVVMYLILTRLTGVPPLEKAMLKSKGQAYVDYQNRVGAFFPRPARKPTTSAGATR
jgi:steroid 5-alpha reductase family enzyme